MTALTDSTRERVWLWHFLVRDENDQPLDLYLSQGVFITEPGDSLPNVAFRNVVRGALQYQIDLLGLGPREDADIAFGSVELVNDGDLDVFRRYAWGGAAGELDLVLKGAAYSTRQRVATVTASAIQPAGGRTELRILLDSPLKALDVPLTTDTFAGSGGAEGPASIEGQTVPVGLGVSRGADWVLLDAAKQIYGGHVGSDVHDVPAASEGGSAITKGTLRASFAVLDSTAPTAGQYDYVLSGGAYARLGSAPNRPVAFDLQGDKTGGSYVESAAQIGARLITAYAGLAASAYDAASVAALHAANPAACGIWIKNGGGKTVLQALREVLWSVGARPLPGIDGVIRFVRHEAPTITGADHADCAMAFSGFAGSPYRPIDRDTLRPLALDIPPWRIDGRYKRVYAPTDNLVSTADKAYWSSAWRTAFVERPATLTRHPASKPLAIELLLDVQADAEAELARLDPLLAVDRYAFAFSTGPWAAALQEGDEVWIEHPDWDLAAGVAAVVLARGFDARNDTVSLGVWF